MKGIILAGGSGTRLYPITEGASKQLLPIYDKPMIYYPLSVLLLGGIKEILIISTPEDLPRFKTLLGDGGHLGVSFEYIVQLSPDGIAQAFILAEDFLDGDSACLILGDNIFYGDGLIELLSKSIQLANKDTASVFGYYVNDPQRYGVAEFDQDMRVISIIEKPKNPKSNYAVIGLYFYPNDVVSKAKHITPSDRGELEITTLNQYYLKEERLNVNLMGRGYAWFDAGTHDSLLETSQFVQVIENRQGLKIACIEEIVHRLGYISKEDLKKLAKRYAKNNYGKYLMRVANE